MSEQVTAREWMNEWTYAPTSLFKGDEIVLCHKWCIRYFLQVFKNV